MNQMRRRGTRRRRALQAHKEHTPQIGGMVNECNGDITRPLHSKPPTAASLTLPEGNQTRAEINRFRADSVYIRAALNCFGGTPNTGQQTEQLTGEISSLSFLQQRITQTTWKSRHHMEDMP